MLSMSRNLKLAIIFSGIAIAIGISIMLATGYNKILAGLFLGAASEDQGYTLGYSTHSPAILTVGEKGMYTSGAKSEKAPPFLFE